MKKIIVVFLCLMMVSGLYAETVYTYVFKVIDFPQNRFRISPDGVTPVQYINFSDMGLNIPNPECFEVTRCSANLKGNYGVLHIVPSDVDQARLDNLVSKDLLILVSRTEVAAVNGGVSANQIEINDLPKDF